jgi:long-subunit acyl-CoA synthetase (AMP-forming)
MIAGTATDALQRWVTLQPDRIAVRCGAATITHGRLQDLVAMVARKLAAAGVARCAVYLDNGPGWVVVDLALRSIGAVIVPLPLFFSPAQCAHALRSSGADAVIAFADHAALLGAEAGLPVADAPELSGVQLHRLDHQPSALPVGTRKVTFTSGTTGRPKGVCLSAESIDTIARNLCAATQGNAADRHLSILPFATLLENIAGIDIPLMAGAELCAVPLAELGLSGSSGLDAARMAAALARFRPTSIVTVPQILAALVAMVEQHFLRPDGLRHVAVGGAVPARGLIARARQLGLPVFEGYGLSECGSVVTLNTCQADRPGSVGRPLPHCQVRLARDGEVLVSGAAALGYLGSEEGMAVTTWGEVATGDLGYFDADGFLHIVGRKKNVFITAFGRNVAPDWVESELATMPVIAQAFVHGEARPWNAAIIVPNPGLLAQHEVEPRSLIDSAIAQVNQRLPDYARIGAWIMADEPFLAINNQLTWNGRLRRGEIAARYRDRLDNLYGKGKAYVHG